MKTIEYYCGEQFDVRCGEFLSAAQWLSKKIAYAHDLHYKLAHEHYELRDNVRIRRIDSAIKDWECQYNEIFGIESEVE